MHIWYMYVLCKWCVCQHCAILDPIRQSSHTHLDGNLHPLGFVEEFYRYPYAAHGRPRIPWYLVATRFHRPVRRKLLLVRQGGGSQAGRGGEIEFSEFTNGGLSVTTPPKDNKKHKRKHLPPHHPTHPTTPPRWQTTLYCAKLTLSIPLTKQPSQAICIWCTTLTRMAKGCTHSRCVTSRVMLWWFSMSWPVGGYISLNKLKSSRASLTYISLRFRNSTFAPYSLHETIAMETTLLFLRNHWLGSDHPT